VEVLAVTLLALAVRLVYLDHTPYVDELNHALAARSLLEDGTLQINGGRPYTRGSLFTYLVAGVVALFGDSLVVGRVPAVLAGTALVVVVFVWVRAIANRWGAWIAALLVCFAPISIYLSQQVRFYTLQTLLFWVGALLVYRVVTAPPANQRRTALLVVATLVCFAVALHLQPVTAFGIAGVCLWVLIDRSIALTRILKNSGTRARLLTAGIVLAGFGVLAAAVASGAIAHAVHTFGHVDMWAEHQQTNIRFYHDLFVHQYPTIWTLFPLLLLVAASRYLRPTVFLAIVFGLALLSHSLAAWKHERYFFYAMPFFFAITGLASAVVVPWLKSRFELLLGHLPGLTPASRFGTTLFGITIAAAAVFAAAGNSATSYTYRMLTVSDAEWRMGVAYRGESDWTTVLPELRAVAAESEMVVASSTLRALYYLGRVDVGLNANELAWTRRGREFSIAAKEAVPLVSAPESIALLQSCFRSGLIIADQRTWRHHWGVPAATADFIEESLTSVPLRAASGVLGYRWVNPSAGVAAECAALAHR
jgi:4-amino-4-deoxy-L-arabinose transferase-like glycosyltransferase